MHDWPRVLAARERPMAERLQVAVSWNRTVAALRSGLARERGVALRSGPAEQRRGRRVAGD